jgi:hypothetical protein
MRNVALIVTLFGLTLALFTSDCGEISALYSRQTTQLRIVNDTTIKHSDNVGICSLVNTQSPSRWWTSNFENILNASRHPNDPNHTYDEWTRAIFTSLSPEMLQRGVRARPSAHSLKHIFDIVHKRFMDPDIFPPLKIAVLGGSVTRGQGCQNPILPGSRRLKLNLCAWPSRLERLINTIVGFQVVKIHNLAVSATNLQFGTQIVKYHLYPDALLPDGPDVIFSSFSSNEQAIHQDTTKSVEFSNQKRNRVQDFITANQLARPCRPRPPIVFVDDYLGNKQDFILGEMTFNKVVTEFADWYGHVMHVSSADVVRRHVYADTNETTFSSFWPLETTGEYRGQPSVEVHFGMGGHVAIAWSILFAMFDVVKSYCENQAFQQIMKKDGVKGVFSKQVLDLVDEVPPPELKSSLLLQNVSRQWRENAVRMRNSQSGCNNATEKPPCVFAFLAGPEATARDEVELREYLQPYTIVNKGWEPIMDYGGGGIGKSAKKPGLIATRANASMTFRLTDIAKIVRVINIHRIKSYSDKWAGSNARFTVRVESPAKMMHETQFDVDGYHQMKSSISHLFQHDLKDNMAAIGSNITVTIDLIGGTTYKIIGMMLCEN